MTCRRGGRCGRVSRAGGAAEHLHGFTTLPEPPEVPDAVLRRLDELDVTAWKAPALDALPALYAAVLGDPAGTRALTQTSAPGPQE